MERFPSFQEDEGDQAQDSPHGGLFSCWACLKRAFPWRRLRRRGSDRWRLLIRSASSSSPRSARRPKPGSFRYDPLSYAQNFEENAWDRDDDNSYRGSSRFVVIAPAPAANQAAHLEK